MNYDYYKDYKHDNNLRKGFLKLTNEVFGIDFTAFYENKLWDDNYICHTFFHKERAISNISIMKMILLINNKIVPAIQIGAVCTDKEYRNQGLARKLMEYVFNDYKEFPLIYLSANENAINFYLKTGFKKLNEIIWYEDVDCIYNDAKPLENIDPFSENFKKRLENRIYSKTFDVIESKSVLFFYALERFNKDFYYCRDLDCVILGEKSNDTYELYEVFTDKLISFNELKPYILDPYIKKVRFHFTPDIFIEKFKTESHYDNTRFFKGDFPRELENNFTYPIIFQT